MVPGSIGNNWHGRDETICFVMNVLQIGGIDDIQNVGHLEGMAGCVYGFGRKSVDVRLRG
jgi:hypothetical protein